MFKIVAMLTAAICSLAHAPKIVARPKALHSPSCSNTMADRLFATHKDKARLTTDLLDFLKV